MFLLDAVHNNETLKDVTINRVIMWPFPYYYLQPTQHCIYMYHINSLINNLYVILFCKLHTYIDVNKHHVIKYI